MSDVTTPYEPTEAMMKAGAEVAAPAFLEWSSRQRDQYFLHVRAIYHAMLDARPLSQRSARTLIP